jgi:hypothetical protein
LTGWRGFRFDRRVDIVKAEEKASTMRSVKVGVRMVFVFEETRLKI